MADLQNKILVSTTLEEMLDRYIFSVEDHYREMNIKKISTVIKHIQLRMEEHILALSDRVANETIDDLDSLRALFVELSCTNKLGESDLTGEQKAQKDLVINSGRYKFLRDGNYLTSLFNEEDIDRAVDHAKHNNIKYTHPVEVKEDEVLSKNSQRYKFLRDNGHLVEFGDSSEEVDCKVDTHFDLRVYADCTDTIKANSERYISLRDSDDNFLGIWWSADGPQGTEEKSRNIDEDIDCAIEEHEQKAAAALL